MSELMMIRQLLGGDVMLTTALLIGILLIVMLRRETIAVPGLFRLGVVFFALSVMVPPFLLPLVGYTSGRNPFQAMRGTGMSDDSLLGFLLVNGTGPVLQGLTILCIFNAIMPRVFNTTRKSVEPAVPQKHPLDD